MGYALEIFCDVSREKERSYVSQALSVERFQHVHVDLIGPFPPSDGFTFLLTFIDCYIRWPEVIPVSDISPEVVTKVSTLLGYRASLYLSSNHRPRKPVPVSSSIHPETNVGNTANLNHSVPPFFGWVEGLKPSMPALYQRPFEVPSTTDKHFTIKIKDRTSTISIDWLKSAFLFNDTDSTKEPFPEKKRNHPVVLSPR
ncbi:hypothetical protein TNCV_3364171 [Trichonephila clavipes]|nr:hypothetical protein TNCV_3364171 [Trichonephila clavipes]